MNEFFSVIGMIVVMYVGSRILWAVLNKVFGND